MSLYVVSIKGGDKPTTRPVLDIRNEMMHRSAIRWSLVCAFLLGLSFGHLKGQQPEIGVSLGMSNYQGDLPSYNFQDGFRIKAHPELGIFLRYPVLPVLSVRGDLRFTWVSGDDALHESENGRQRNLQFRSSILQAFLHAELYPLMFFRDEVPRLNPFISGGVGAMYFNPKTRYEGEWVALHPLNTEGQGLAAFPDQDPYSLLQLLLPLGGGLKWDINGTWSIGAEMHAFFLMTDYLDDVSTIYISYPELLELKGPVTAALANREGEYLGTPPVVVNTGSQRGNPGSNDFFVTGALTLQCSLDAIFTPRSRQFKKKCPKF